MKELTVGALKQIIENTPDDYIVTIGSDSGVDQCAYDDYSVIIVEDAYESNNNLVIYANFRDEGEEEEQW